MVSSSLRGAHNTGGTEAGVAPRLNDDVRTFVDGALHRAVPRDREDTMKPTSSPTLGTQLLNGGPKPESGPIMRVPLTGLAARRTAVNPFAGAAVHTPLILAKYPLIGVDAEVVDVVKRPVRVRPARIGDAACRRVLLRRRPVPPVSASPSSASSRHLGCSGTDLAQVDGQRSDEGSSCGRPADAVRVVDDRHPPVERHFGGKLGRRLIAGPAKSLRHRRAEGERRETGRCRDFELVEERSDRPEMRGVRDAEERQ